MLKVAILFILQAFWVVVHGQGGQTVGIPTHQMPYSLYSTQGVLSANGSEINLWVLPYINTTVHATGSVSATFLEISDDIQIAMAYNATEMTLGFTLTQISNSVIQKGYVAVVTQALWINLNIRIAYGKYILMNGWQGNNSYEINPSFKILITQCPIYTSDTFNIKTTPSDFGVYWSGLRIYALDIANPWGLYLRQYTTGSPAQFTRLVQSIYAFGNYIIYQTGQPTDTIGSADTIDFKLESCDLYYALQKDGTCLQTCLISKCLVCQTIDSSYSNLCRYCDPSAPICAVQSQCPIGYYSENSICYKCPLGCSSCTNGTTCTTCNTGLVLYSQTSSNATLCQCTIGYYQVATTTASGIILSCAACDSSCATCNITKTNCTSCSNSLFLYNNLCISSCASVVSNQYGDTGTNTCKTCPSNCLQCSSYYNCTNCAINPSNSTKYLNFAGQCVTYCNSSGILSASTQQCLPCATHCSSCSQITSNCTSCVANSGYSLYNKQCLAACPTGLYSQSQTCQQCQSSCTSCTSANTCQTCAISYYFVNNQCLNMCPIKYYPDTSNPTFFFCRSCPSNCYSCTSAKTCNQCASGFYSIATSGGYYLCVSPTNCGTGFYPVASTQSCQPCISNCISCTGGSTCLVCNNGYFLKADGTCSTTCPAAYYASYKGVCLPCISNCQACSTSITCDTCSPTYFLLSGIGTCASSCPPGYYTSGVQCLLCQAQCKTCTSYSVCTSCIVDYTLSTGSSICISNCGNGLRESNEQCDDGNSVSGDGCSSLCNTEPGYICDPLLVSTTGPDLCNCDPGLESAVWADNWGQIQLQFSSTLDYSSTTGSQSNDPQVFCTQILDSSTTALLGTNYQCSMWTSTTGTTIYINIGSDSTIGNTATSYQTTITLQSGALKIIGGLCPQVSIPSTYRIMNLPIKTPKVILSTNTGSLTISKCQTSFILDVLYSKGFTKRAIQSTWSVVTMSPSNSILLSSIQSGAITTYKNYHYLMLGESDIESFAGITLTLRASVTNFLGNSAQNVTSIVFSNNKKIEIYDVPDVLTLSISDTNKIYPRFKLSYCAGDSLVNAPSDYLQISYTCQIFALSTSSILTSLTNCTIPSNYMSISTQYGVKVTASNSNNAAMNTFKTVIINPQSPKIEASSIKGCNALFLASQPFSLTVIFNTNVTNAQYSWNCIDMQSGSTCFSTSYKYIQISNTKTITIAGSQLFPNMQYQFTATVTDTISGTTGSYQCNMYSSASTQSVIQFQIQSDANRNGYMDFDTQTNSFKAQLLYPQLVNLKKLAYTWTITDASNTTFSSSVLSIYQNSVSIPTSQLKRSNQYTVKVSVTDGTSIGYQTIYYNTDPSLSVEFFVEPSSGVSLQTYFALQVTSQAIIEGLYTYVYGYINPVDLTMTPMYQRTYKRSVIITLPSLPSSATTLQCYVEVIQSNGAAKIYYQSVTLSSTTLSAATFNTQVAQAVMDDFSESMMMRNKLTALQSLLTSQNQADAINKILDGLQYETIPLSDQTIQISVASTLDFISQTLSSTAVLSSAILTRSAAIFNQITTTENILISTGQYTKFKKQATDSLFNYANNVFQQDFTSIIGQSAQQIMKTNIMTGLKNVLKGSLSNSILGDKGGYSYQGYNVSSKAIKFDPLESNYIINVSLPLSLAGKLSQNFVNISLPNNSTWSNPCSQYEACQVSIIILDSPITSFLSNSKDAILKSMIVDVSIQKTELVSQNTTYINIMDLTITSLTTTVNITMPILSVLNTAIANRTLGCGYIDPLDQILKVDGVVMQSLTGLIQTCMTNHLTAFAVQEYTGSASTSVIASSTALQNVTSNDIQQKARLGSSWAIYIEVILLIVLGLGIFWGYKRDQKDQRNYELIKENKRKLYVGLYLEPFASVNNSRLDNEKIIATMQQIEKEKNEQADQNYEQLDNNQFDESQRMSPDQWRGEVQPQQEQQPYFQPYPHEFMMESPQIYQQQQQEPNNVQEIEQSVLNNTQGVLMMEETGMRKTKKVMKKKKKKKAGGQGMDNTNGFDQTMNQFRQNRVFEAQKDHENNNGEDNYQKKNQEMLDDSNQGFEHNIFFEGGQKSDDSEIYYEGGDSDNQEDEDAQTIKSKRTKKKGHKKKSSTKRKDSFAAETLGNEGEQALFQKNNNHLNMNETVQSSKSKGRKSSRSSSKRKQKSSLAIDKRNEQIDGVGFNSVTSFNTAKGPNQNNSTNELHLIAKKKSKPKRSTSRGSKRSRVSSGSLDNIEAPDQEATIVSPNKKGINPYGTQEFDVKKPIINKQKKSKKKKINDVKAQDRTGDDNDINLEQNNQQEQDDEEIQGNSKGFDTLMGEGRGKKSINSPSPKKIGNKSKLKQPKIRQEAAGCCVLYFWQWRESHRLFSLYRHYNDYLSRPARVVLFILSFFLYIMVSGILIDGSNIIDDKDVHTEQFVCGFIAAFVTKIIIAIFTNLMRHPKPSDRYLQFNSRSKFLAKCDRIRYWAGMIGAGVLIMMSFIYSFVLSAHLKGYLVSCWGWAFMCALVCDLIILEMISLAFAVILVLLVGSAPDACGIFRNCCLRILLQSTKDTVR